MSECSQDRPERVGSREWISRKELLLDVLVRCELAGLRLAKALLYLGDETQTLDRILERGIVGKGAQGLEGALLGARIRHDRIVAPGDSVAA